MGWLLALLFVWLPGTPPAPPTVDHHQHLFSPALAALIKVGPITAADLVRHLDDAGIKRAVVLSTAYSFSNPARKVENDYEFVRADNDWTAAQVALYPDRLTGFCGVNPLKDYALGELARCAKNPNLARGLKLHFGVFVDAIAKGDPRTKNLWFDVTSVASSPTPFNTQRIADRIRQLGVQRVVFGSDAATPNNLPRLAWEAFRKVPLTDAELSRIENNVAPYLR